MRYLTRFLALAIGSAVLGLSAQRIAVGQASNASQVASPVEQRVTMVLDNEDVRLALKTLFAKVGVNFVLDQSIQGFATVSLTDVSFRTALESILRSSWPMDLGYTVEDGIYTVSPKPANGIESTPVGGEYALAEVSPSRVVKIHLKYADAIDLALALGGTVIISRFSGAGVYGFGYGTGFASGGYSPGSFFGFSRY